MIIRITVASGVPQTNNRVHRSIANSKAYCSRKSASYWRPSAVRPVKQDREGALRALSRCLLGGRDLARGMATGNHGCLELIPGPSLSEMNLLVEPCPPEMHDHNMLPHNVLKRRPDMQFPWNTPHSMAICGSPILFAAGSIGSSNQRQLWTGVPRGSIGIQDAAGDRDD